MQITYNTEKKEMLISIHTKNSGNYVKNRIVIPIYLFNFNNMNKMFREYNGNFYYLPLCVTDQVIVSQKHKNKILTAEEIHQLDEKGLKFDRKIGIVTSTKMEQLKALVKYGRFDKLCEGIDGTEPGYYDKMILSTVLNNIKCNVKMQPYGKNVINIYLRKGGKYLFHFNIFAKKGVIYSKDDDTFFLNVNNEPPDYSVKTEITKLKPIEELI